MTAAQTDGEKMATITPDSPIADIVAHFRTALATIRRHRIEGAVIPVEAEILERLLDAAEHPHA